MSYQSTIPSAASFFVKSVPSLANSQSLLLYAGNLPAREPATVTSHEPQDDAHLYFLLEKARHIGTKRRLVIWLNGGPGCSSFDGVMMEIGSFRPSLTSKGNLEWTTPGGAWNEYADVLFLDQPVGTGFSYANTDGYAKTLDEAARDVNFFLKRFLDVFPEYKRESGAEVYIAGESFAGNYIPYTAREIVQDRSSQVDLKGIVIGNGSLDPKSQTGSELDMLLEAGVWKEGDKEVKKLREKTEKCEAIKKKLPADKNPQDIAGCSDLLQEVINLSYQSINGQSRCINIYDVRLSDEFPACGMTWPPTLKPTYDYLARQDVRAAFHVNAKKHPEAWIECSNRVSSALHRDESPASVTLLPGLLQSGVKVLLFAGNQDLICNHIGIERTIDNLEWAGEKGWGSSAATKLKWTVDSKPAGYWQTRSNLTYVNVFDASHMVGFDKPVEAHDMMLRFMGVNFLDAAGPSALLQSSLEGEPERKVILGGGGGSSGAAAGSELGATPMITGPDGKTEEQVAEEAKWAAYYNAGTAALIVILVLVTVGTCILLRLRRNAQRRGGGGGGKGLFLGGGSGSGSDAQSRRKEAMEMELERLVEEGEGEGEEDEDRSGRESTETRGEYTAGTGNKGKARERDDDDADA